MCKPSAIYLKKKKKQKLSLYVFTTRLFSNSRRRGSAAKNKHLLRLKAVLQENDNIQHRPGSNQNNQMKDSKNRLIEPNGKIDWGNKKKKKSSR